MDVKTGRKKLIIIDLKSVAAIYIYLFLQVYYRAWGPEQRGQIWLAVLPGKQDQPTILYRRNTKQNCGKYEGWAGYPAAGYRILKLSGYRISS